MLPNLAKICPFDCNWPNTSEFEAGKLIDYAAVARAVGRKELENTPRRNKHSKREWGKLRNIGGKGVGAWDESEVLEWDEIKKKCPDLFQIHVVSFHEVCVEKRKSSGRASHLGDAHR